MRHLREHRLSEQGAHRRWLSSKCGATMCACPMAARHPRIHAPPRRGGGRAAARRRPAGAGAAVPLPGGPGDARDSRRQDRRRANRRWPAPRANCARKPATRAAEWACAGMLHNAAAYSDEGHRDLVRARPCAPASSSLDAGRVPRDRAMPRDELEALPRQRRAHRRQDPDRRCCGCRSGAPACGHWTGSRRRVAAADNAAMKVSTCAAPTATASKAGLPPTTTSWTRTAAA